MTLRSPPPTAFTATEAARILGVTRRAIVDWGGRGLVEAEVHQSTGRGSRRLYSARNLVQFAFFREAFRLGITRAEAKKALDECTDRDGWLFFVNGKVTKDPKLLGNANSYIVINMGCLIQEVRDATS